MGLDSQGDWQWKARRVLSRFGPRTVPALIEALCGGEDPAIRRFAAESLAHLGPEARGASDALQHAAWHDVDPSVREAAVSALNAIAEPRLS
ncbi:MAG TPA: HEAT repeat domain-containing protein [Methylomirabilota bacterium]|jgi:HEAT repeat protein|nr:HEAT repeat domain-containing protein [Methylomirabilota bacterium]